MAERTITLTLSQLAMLRTIPLAPDQHRAAAMAFEAEAISCLEEALREQATRNSQRGASHG